MPPSPRPQQSVDVRSTRRRLAAGLLVSSVAVGGLVIVGGSPASAATAPLAQSAGRFLDGSLGGNAVQQLADLTDARATAPGTQTTQNPLNATVANSLNVPLTGALQLPTIAGIKLGAANQVAVAHSDGYSYGASGAVANSGGVSVGGNNNAYPAGAEIDLDASALGALPTIPVPGASAAGALGAVKVKIGAVSSLAQTTSGGAIVPLGTNHYGIASLSLSLGSPALAGLLGQVTSQSGTLTGLLAPVITALGLASQTVPGSCAITAGTLPSSISLDSGAIVIDASTGTITVDVAKLLQVLGLNINSLPANTDLLSYVLTNLPTILAAGLPAVVNGIITPLETAFAACVTALGPLAGLLGPVLTTLTTGQATVESTLSQVAAGLASAAPGGLGALSTALGQLLTVGVNVQAGPGAGTTNANHPFTSKLKATTDQADTPVTNQTIVRAVEVDLAGGQVAAIALANSAAGPSTKAAVVVTTPAAPTTAAPVTDIPTKINAGKAAPGGNPQLPVILLVGALVMAAAGGIAWKIRGTHA